MQFIRFSLSCRRNWTGTEVYSEAVCIRGQQQLSLGNYRSGTGRQQATTGSNNTYYFTVHDFS